MSNSAVQQVNKLVVLLFFSHEQLCRSTGYEPQQHIYVFTDKCFI
jgi:hypothetical protein